MERRHAGVARPLDRSSPRGVGGTHRGDRDDSPSLRVTRPCRGRPYAPFFRSFSWSFIRLSFSSCVGTLAGATSSLPPPPPLPQPLTKVIEPSASPNRKTPRRREPVSRMIPPWRDVDPEMVTCVDRIRGNPLTLNNSDSLTDSINTM